MTHKYWNSLMDKLDKIKYFETYGLIKHQGLGFTNHIDVEKGDVIKKIIVHRAYEDDRWNEDWLEMYVDHNGRLFQNNPIYESKRYVVNRSEIKTVKFL